VNSRAGKYWLFLVAILLLPAWALGQAEPYFDLRKPLPLIEFGAWKEAGNSDIADEFALSFPSAYPSAYKINNTVPLRIFLP